MKKVFTYYNVEIRDYRGGAGDIAVPYNINFETEEEANKYYEEKKKENSRFSYVRVYPPTKETIEFGDEQDGYNIV